MNLESKKILAAKALNVGKRRIIFNTGRLAEINEAISKHEMRELANDGAILIREVSGRLKVEKRNGRRGQGKVRMKVLNSKKQYVILTRKLRGYLKELKLQEKLDTEDYKKLRKEVKSKQFRSKSHLKERMATLEEE